MSHVLVICYGNPLRSDDGVGWHVAQNLAEKCRSLDCKIIACHQLTPELAEEVSNARLVIFVDARIGDCPGKIHTHDVLPEPKPPPTFSHSLNPSTLLASAAALYGSAPPAKIVTITAETVSHGETLSSTVRAALPELLKKVRTIIEQE